MAADCPEPEVALTPPASTVTVFALATVSSPTVWLPSADSFRPSALPAAEVALTPPACTVTVFLPVFFAVASTPVAVPSSELALTPPACTVTVFALETVFSPAVLLPSALRFRPLASPCAEVALTPPPAVTVFALPFFAPASTPVALVLPVALMARGSFASAASPSPAPDSSATFTSTVLSPFSTLVFTPVALPTSPVAVTVPTAMSLLPPSRPKSYVWAKMPMADPLIQGLLRFLLLFVTSMSPAVIWFSTPCDFALTPVA